MADAQTRRSWKSRLAWGVTVVALAIAASFNYWRPESFRLNWEGSGKVPSLSSSLSPSTSHPPSIDPSPTVSSPSPASDPSAGYTSGDPQFDAQLRVELRRWQADFGFDTQVFDQAIRCAVRCLRPFLFFRGGRDAIPEACRIAHEEATKARQQLGRAELAFGRVGREDALRKGTYLLNAIEQVASDWLQDKTVADLDPAASEIADHPDRADVPLRAGGGKIFNSAGRLVWAGRPDLPAAVNARVAAAMMECVDEFALSEQTIPVLEQIVLSRLILLQSDPYGQPPTEAARTRACDAGIAWLRDARDKGRPLFQRTGWTNLPRLARLSRQEAARHHTLETGTATRRGGSPDGDSDDSGVPTASAWSNAGGGIIQTSSTIEIQNRPALLSAPFDAVSAQTAQRWWAEGLKMPVRFTNSIGIPFVLVPAGEFLMGSTPAEFNQVLRFDASFSKEWETEEHPQHRVRISRPFYLGRHEVTRGQFAAFVIATGYETDARRDGKGGFGFDPTTGVVKQDRKYDWQNPGFPQTDNEPVVNVSWNDANAFCEWLSRKERRTYRLPTEAEWEHACRAGTTTLYFNGNDPESLAQVGNVCDGSAKSKFAKWNTIRARDGFVFTAPVGSLRPNAFGLFDMHGNVWEWCRDWYGADYYAKSPERDPQGPEQGKVRVFRGGSWYDAAGFCRSAFRYWDVPSYRDYFLGFRVAAAAGK